MTKISSTFLQLMVGLVVSATCIFAQTSGSYGGQVSPTQAAPPESMARPGSLNYIEGEVSGNGEPLNLQAVGHFALKPGQALNTGANGYAEVLLTPGAFLRVGPNSELRMPAVGLGDTRVTLTHGNALLEADEVVPGSHLEVTVGTTSVDLLKKGLYGFSTDPPSVRTFQGKADVIGLRKKHQVGGHDEILLASNDGLKTTRFDEGQAKKEPLYVWSETRSREEAAQNKLVAQNSQGYAPVGGGWFWDPYVNYYGFWPDAYFNSPFGFGFYGGFYPGFYGGGYYRGGFRGGIFGRGYHGGGYRGFAGIHGNGVGGGFHGAVGGGFHGGGGGRR